MFAGEAWVAIPIIDKVHFINVQASLFLSMRGDVGLGGRWELRVYYNETVWTDLLCFLDYFVT